MPTLSGYRKAIAGAVVAAATWFATAFPDGIDRDEWAVLPISVLVGAGVVAAVKNTP